MLVSVCKLVGAAVTTCLLKAAIGKTQRDSRRT